MIETSGHDPLCLLPKGFGDCICAELAAAEQRGYSETAMNSAWMNGYKQGQRDMLARCIAVVEALPHDGYCVATDPNYVRLCECLRADAIAALRALGGSDE